MKRNVGSATVLCVDKTGTLTVNRMSIRKPAVGGTVLDVEQPADGRIREHSLVRGIEDVKKKWWAVP